MRNHGVRSVLSLAASAPLAVCGVLAGVAGSAMALDGALTTLPGARGETLSFGSTGVFHTTTNPIENLRTIAVPGTPEVLILWDERAAGGSVQSYFAVSLDGATIAGRVQDTTYLVRLRGREFDPLAVGAPKVDRALRAPTTSDQYLVQFWVPPMESFRGQITALGGRVDRFMTDHVHLVRMSPEVRDAVAALPFVRWVGPNQVAYRLDEAVVDVLATPGDGAEEPAFYNIEVLQRGMTEQAAVADRIAALGGQVHTTTPEGFRLMASLTPTQVLEIARLNEVYMIDPWGPGGADMNIARQIGGASTILEPAGFQGQGVRGEIFDTGIRSTHVAFSGPAIAPLMHGAAIIDSHGTSCYGINFGDGESSTSLAGKGMCPLAEQGVFAQYSNVQPFGAKSRYTHTAECIDPAGPYRVIFQTASVGSTQVSSYTAISTETDDYLFLHQLLSTQSQSNLGSTLSRPQAWAKNIVAVGGIEHNNTLDRANDFWQFASTGPAADGRVKPDLAHFYDDIYTTDSASNTAYTGSTAGGGFGGTSGATPITAGHFGLLHQMWRDEVFPGHGDASKTVFAARPHVATAKALMVNSAFRYVWTTTSSGVPGNLTRFRQGWGMADLGNLYNRRNTMFIVDETDLLTHLSSKSYEIDVPAGEPTLNVTMVYMDVKGPTSAAQHRVNDLSLKVTSPSGTVYWGNNGLSAGNFSTAGGVSNKVDTVENVFVQSPAAGTWTVEVFGDQILADTHTETPGLDADYALVVTGGTEGGGCDCVCDYDTSTGAGVCDFFDFVAFQDLFGASDPCGCELDTTTGPGVCDFFDFVAFQDLFSVGCP